VEVIGTMAFGGNQPVERNTLFRLASTTKPITALGAMTLVEECRLRLDNPIELWLPELGNRRVLRALESPIDDTIAATRRLGSQVSASSLRDLTSLRHVVMVSPPAPLDSGRHDCFQQHNAQVLSAPERDRQPVWPHGCLSSFPQTIRESPANDRRLTQRATYLEAG
jgi:hypothetical protein